MALRDFTSNMWTAAALAFAVYQVLHFLCVVVYRLCCSPLAKFPGSRLAAATGWYEFYFDYWCNGKYIFEIERMHAKYGPIIRINPDELSIRDPDFYNDIYVTESKRRTEHYDVFCKGIDFDGSHLLTRDHDVHRRRRKPLDPFFSRVGVQKLQSMLADVAFRLEQRLRKEGKLGRIVRLDHAFSAYSGDIIGRICLSGASNGESFKREEFLDDPGLGKDWYDLIHNLVRSIPLFTAFPSVVNIVSYIPESLLLRAFPQGQVFNDFKEKAKECVRTAMILKSSNDKKGVETDDKGNIFVHIANSDMPESERSEERLAKEAQVLLGGGTATTAKTMTFGAYYILSRPEILSRLRDELKDVMSLWPENVPSWPELERLPYLQAVIKETLRLSYGVMHRLPRVSPDVPIRYKQYTIPIGVPVSMSTYYMHSDPSVFPEPDKFIPDRWLGAVNPKMQKSYVPFCRGSRNCLGMNLAMAEMSLAFAMLFRPNAPRMELFETNESDVKPVHDFMIPLSRLDSEGVRVIIKESEMN